MLHITFSSFLPELQCQNYEMEHLNFDKFLLGVLEKSWDPADLNQDLDPYHYWSNNTIL